jgi:hypothetical protein
MAFALLLLPVLLIVCRSDLGIKGIAFCIALFLGLIIVVVISGLPPVVLAAGAAVLDIGIIIFVWGDIPLRPRT